MHWDILDIKWKDVETGHICRVTHFTNVGNLVLVWYIDMGTKEEHCMSCNIFTLKHEACGSYALTSEGA